MIIMLSVKTTIFKFGALESSAIRSLIIMFNKVGPETYHCGHTLVTCLELNEFPNVTWALRSLMKFLTIL
jgi:hypothetical protein